MQLLILWSHIPNIAVKPDTSDRANISQHGIGNHLGLSIPLLSLWFIVANIYFKCYLAATIGPLSRRHGYYVRLVTEIICCDPMLEDCVHPKHGPRLKGAHKVQLD